MALVRLPVGVHAFVRYVPAAAETCVCTCAGRVRGSAPVRLADTLPSWMFGVSGGWSLGHKVERVGVKLLHVVSALHVSRRSRPCPAQPRGDIDIDMQPGFPDVQTLLGPVGCGLAHPARQPAGG